jgi:hypothetical protein
VLPQPVVQNLPSVKRLCSPNSLCVSGERFYTRNSIFLTLRVTIAEFGFFVSVTERQLCFHPSKTKIKVI